MVRVPTYREPPRPVLLPMEITQRRLADTIHVLFQCVNEIVNDKRGVTPSTSLRLAKLFGVLDSLLSYKITAVRLTIQGRTH